MSDITIAALIMCGPTVIAGVALFIAFRAWQEAHRIHKQGTLDRALLQVLAQRAGLLEGGGNG